jgi:hypothetical protein
MALVSCVILILSRQPFTCYVQLNEHDGWGWGIARLGLERLLARHQLWPGHVACSLARGDAGTRHLWPATLACREWHTTRHPGLSGTPNRGVIITPFPGLGVPARGPVAPTLYIDPGFAPTSTAVPHPPRPHWAHFAFPGFHHNGTPVHGKDN